MEIVVDIQNTIASTRLPEEALVQQWITAALVAANYSGPSAEMSVRIVDEEESQQLNSEFRGKDKPTNVLSFPFEAPPGIEIDLLGDLVICEPIVEAEAALQGKSAEIHWAHLIIHGTLHLLGFDHIASADAEVMESLEIRILSQFGIANPYN